MRQAKAALFSFVILISIALVGCNNSSVDDAIEEGQDLINGGPKRKTIDTSRLGVNAFVNDSRFGSISGQFGEVKNTLGLSFVRILFNWDDAVQPSPSSAPNFSFYDAIAASLPAGVDAVAVLTGVPSWVSNPANWTGGDPRTTFVEQFVRKVAQRYRGNGRIIAWEIWNEPNMTSNADNQLLDIAANPENYVELLGKAHSVIKSISPNKIVVNAATTAINQNFPGTLDYNKRMAAAGVDSFVDRYNAHYYGRQFENVLVPDGVSDFLNERPVPIWITESGAQGVNNQLAYGEQVWPFLIEKISSIERIYVYQFTEATPSDSTYGLKNLSGDFPVSDLYVWLRDRQQ